MAYSDDYNLYASQNPSEATPPAMAQPQQAEQSTTGDPLIEATFAPPPEQPAPYGGLRGDPYHTAVISMAQLQVHNRKRGGQRVQNPATPMFPQMAGLSALLGR